MGAHPGVGSPGQYVTAHGGILRPMTTIARELALAGFTIGTLTGTPSKVLRPPERGDRCTCTTCPCRAKLSRYSDDPLCWACAHAGHQPPPEAAADATGSVAPQHTT